MNSSDLIYDTRDGYIQSGGFSVNSLMMKYGISPFSATLNTEKNGGGANVSNLYEGLAVPIGLGLGVFNGGQPPSYNNEEDDLEGGAKVIDDDLYDKLLQLVTVTDDEIHRKHKKSTRKCNNKNKNKTKKSLKIKAGN
jgi:hypothetical protein